MEELFETTVECINTHLDDLGVEQDAFDLVVTIVLKHVMSYKDNEKGKTAIHWMGDSMVINTPYEDFNKVMKDYYNKQ